MYLEYLDYTQTNKYSNAQSHAHDDISNIHKAQRVGVLEVHQLSHICNYIPQASIHTQPTSTRDTIHQLISGFPKNNAAKLQEAINIIQAFQVLLRKLNTTTGFLDILRP